MSSALQNVDWDLLHQQKLTLLAIREHRRPDSSEYEALSGIIHLLDALQDEAADEGRWQFPSDDDEKGASHER